ncbi:hypothetical protein AA313_de0201215 [Arthrobotrys entomopaga]|nr:hypothetical protein AA313_de0201215 [Arthrobotrys entomopaga]
MTTVCFRLSMGTTKDFFTVGIEAGTPQLHTGHQLLGTFEFSLLSKHGIDELFARLLAHSDTWRTLSNRVGFTSLEGLSAAPHVLLAVLEEALHAVPQTITGFKKVGDKNKILSSFDAIVLDHFPGTFALAAKLNEEQPELSSLFGDCRTCSVTEDGPIVDPFP